MSDEERSRIARAASEAFHVEEGRAHDLLVNARIAVSLDDESANSLATFFACVRMCLLTVDTAIVALPQGCDDAWRTCLRIADGLGLTGHLTRVFQLDNALFETAVRVGRQGSADPRVVTVNSSGWLVRLAAKASLDGPSAEFLEFEPGADPPNPIGAMAAAALGMSEAFMRLWQPRPEISFEWSLFDNKKHSLNKGAAGPKIASTLPIQALLVGAGTVGAGFVYVISHLPIEGTLLIVDSQRVGPENFGPHLFAVRGAYGEPKAELLAKQLQIAPGDMLKVRTFCEPFSLFRLRIANEVCPPNTVVSGLDKAVPRHQVQRLWAPVHIDMATGGLQSQVMVRTNPGTGRCMIEAFGLGNERLEEEEWSQRTGLSVQSLNDPMSLITEEDVALAHPSKRSELEDARKKRLRRCNIVIANELGVKGSGANFAASVPFNALLAGAMAAGELVKSASMSRDGVFVRYNFPNHGVFEDLTHSIDGCECEQYPGRTNRQ